MHRGRGKKRTRHHHSGRQRTGPAVEGMMLREVGRGRKGNPDGRTMGPTGTWYQVEGGKVRKPDEGRKAQACTRNSFGTLEGEGSADERWRPADGASSRWTVSP